MGWLGSIAELLDDLGVPWVLAGALAADRYRAGTRYEYQRLAIDRSLADHVLTVEDVIIHKLIAWRLKDRDDIASILSAGPDLDETYIDEWARAWEVADRWAEARA